MDSNYFEAFLQEFQQTNMLDRLWDFQHAKGYNLYTCYQIKTGGIL